MVVAPMMGKKGKRFAHSILLGHYPSLSLKEARAKVPQTLAMMAEGRHPKYEARKLDEDTVALALDDFLAHLRKKKLRTVGHTEQALRRALLGQKRVNGEWQDDGHDHVFRHRAVTSITRSDIIKRLEQIEKKYKKHAARHALASIRRFFNFCFDRERIRELPTLRLSDSNTLGIRGSELRRQRVLNDGELNDIWAVAQGLGYPFGNLVQLLLLTGQRRSEWQFAHYNEINRQTQVLTVPAARFKSGNSHEVPLTPKVLEILDGLPIVNTDGYVFTLDGKRAYKSIDFHRKKFDAALNRRRAARGQGPISHWVLHDLRRTCRTRLADLEVAEQTAELVIGHTLPTLHAVYNLSSHRNQKFEALQKWESLLMSIVEPQPGAPTNIIRLRA